MEGDEHMIMRSKKEDWYLRSGVNNETMGEIGLVDIFNNYAYIFICFHLHQTLYNYDFNTNAETLASGYNS